MALEDLLSFSQDGIFPWMTEKSDGAKCIWECNSQIPQKFWLKEKNLSNWDAVKVYPVVFVVSLLSWSLVASCSFALLMKLWGMRYLTFVGSCSCLCRTICLARLCPVSEWEVGNYVSGDNTKTVHSVWACNTLLIERSFLCQDLEVRICTNVWTV